MKIGLGDRQKVLGDKNYCIAQTFSRYIAVQLGWKLSNHLFALH